MAIKIEQGFKYKGDDYWKWWIWIEGSEEELDQIDHVIYTLHRTFSNPVRTVADRATKFRLDTSGWGVFWIYANVVNKEGGNERLSHYLVLKYPDGTPTTA